MSGRGWAIWFVAWFTPFLYFETSALVRKRYDLTLSDAIWRLEQLRTGQPIYQWTAGHILIGGVLALTLLWLTGHFVLGWWR